jgi:hypothetical protein
LSADGHVAIAQTFEHLAREQVFRAFDFLKTQDVGLFLSQEAFDLVDAQANRIDVFQVAISIMPRALDTPSGQAIGFRRSGGFRGSWEGE